MTLIILHKAFSLHQPSDQSYSSVLSFVISDTNDIGIIQIALLPTCVKHITIDRIPDIIKFDTITRYFRSSTATIVWSDPFVLKFEGRTVLTRTKITTAITRPLANQLIRDQMVAVNDQKMITTAYRLSCNCNCHTVTQVVREFAPSSFLRWDSVSDNLAD